MSPAPKDFDHRSLRRRLVVIALALVGLGTFLLVKEYRLQASRLSPEQAQELGVLHLPNGSYGVESDFSQILIEEKGPVRTLFFIDDNGRRAVETRMDMTRPHDLLSAYTQTMFASYLFVPKPERVLLIGLGGGAMVRFLEHHDPELAIDAVEIDPMVIEIARDYFGTRPSPQVRILEEDGFDFLKNTSTVYDVVYMDAFLEPSEDTDASGTPLRLKTKAFLRSLQDRIHQDGVIVFNVHKPEGLDVIREVYGQTYVFRLGVPGMVAVGTRSDTRVSAEALRQVADELDARFQANFSFARMVAKLR